MNNSVTIKRNHEHGETREKVVMMMTTSCRRLRPTPWISQNKLCVDHRASLCVYSSIHLYTLHNSPSWPKEKFYVRRATNRAEMDLKKYYSCVPPCGPRRSFWNDAIINSLSWAFVHITVVMFSVWIGRTSSSSQSSSHFSSQWRNEAQFCSSNLIIIFIFIFHSYIYILLGIVALLWDSLLCVSWAAARRFIVIISAKHSFHFQLFSLASADTFCMCFYMKSH